MEYTDAKTIVRSNASVNWNYVACEYIMNIYKGCSHGCIYCYARSEYYEKAGDFDRVRVKRDALQIIRDDLRRKVKPGVVLTGSATDPYIPEEKEYKLTRNALELINAFDFGVCFMTKSALITRDTDIILDIKAHSPASANFSITCSDDETSKKVEPFASASGERFKAIEHLAANGIIAGVLIDPVIPYITDTAENVREMVKKAKHYGAKYIYISPQVTMADVQRDYFFREAGKHYPEIPEKYSMKYKNYYHCRSPVGKKLMAVFAETCEKEGIIYDMRAANLMIRSGYGLSVTGGVTG